MNFESGLTSLPFLLARSCNLRNYSTSLLFIEKFISFQHLAKDILVATVSVLYAVKPHLLFLDPVSALLHTLPPDVLHLLPPTLKPEDHTYVLRKASYLCFSPLWLSFIIISFSTYTQIEPLLTHLAPTLAAPVSSPRAAGSGWAPPVIKTRKNFLALGKHWRRSRLHYNFLKTFEELG